MKKCPYCAEEIQDDAKLCMHCGKEIKAWYNQKIGGAGCLLLLILIFGLIILCINIPDKQSARNDLRTGLLSSVSYLKNIPEVNNIQLDPTDNSTLFVEFNSIPTDVEIILRAAANILSLKKKELTGVSGILVYGTKGGMDFEHAFWMVHARYGRIDESRSW